MRLFWVGLGGGFLVLHTQRIDVFLVLKPALLIFCVGVWVGLNYVHFTFMYVSLTTVNTLHRRPRYDFGL